jgi:hypothetical protein
MADVRAPAPPASLATVDELLRDAVALVASTDPNPADPFRGLYITDEAAREDAAALDGSAVDARLAEVAGRLGLDALDCELLALCAAPELDPRYGRLVAYLHDDVTRRRPSAHLLARLLAGAGCSAGVVLARLSADARLRTCGALRVLDADPQVPVGERGLVPDELVVANLLGAQLDSAAPPTGVRDAALRGPPPGRAEQIAGLARLLAAGDRLVIACVGADAEQALAHAVGANLVVVSAARLADDALLARARLRAELGASLLAIGDVEALGAEELPAFLGALARIDGPRVIVGPRNAHRALLGGAIAVHAVELPELSTAERRELWAVEAPGAAVERAADRFLLSAGQIADAAELARARAHERGGFAPSESDLLAAGREVSRRSLGEVAERLTSSYAWADLVLPAAELDALRAITGFVRHRDEVLGEWGFGALTGNSRGLTALFAGESGTGKTLAAQVIAGDLGVDIYRVDLARVVSKYIGETEKNLDRVFRAAEHANAVLLFDEADALFGKRSAVTDARDRYANIEIAYLLQRLEVYPGVAILTTNRRRDVDQAFLRRIDCAVDFPLPGPEQRLALWRLHLPSQAPLSPDLDLEQLATADELPGGAIRTAARSAAFAAAGDGSAITMAHLRHAVALELQKLGRLTLTSPGGGSATG